MCTTNQAAERGVSQPVRANKRARRVEREEGRVARAPFPVVLSPRTDSVVLALFLLARSFMISICFTFSSAAADAQVTIPRRAAVISVVFIVS